MDPDHTLILLRHAKSDWSTGLPDHERPLAPRGVRQAPDAGRWLADHVAQIDLAVVSTAERARATWSLAAAELGVAPPVRLADEVYGASAEGLLGVVRSLSQDASTVVMVGHNPGLEDLVSALAGTWVPMPTSALAVFAVAGAWTDVGPASVRLTASGRPPR